MTESRAQPVISCEKARAEIREFLRGDMPIARANELRAHRKTCAACDTEYRELVQGVAAISSGARATAASYVPLGERTNPPVRDVRPDGASDTDDAVDGVDVAPPPPRRRSFLSGDPNRRFQLPRMFLPLAVGVAFVALAMQAGTPKVVLVSNGGEVWKGSNTIDAAATLPMARFETCVTGPDGHARLELGSNRVVLEPDTSCLIDRLEVLSVRVYQGTLRIEGEARVLLPLGAVEAKGGVATVTLDEHGIALRNQTGELTYVDGVARRTIAPGTGLHVDAPDVAFDAADADTSAAAQPVEPSTTSTVRDTPEASSGEPRNPDVAAPPR